MTRKYRVHITYRGTASVEVEAADQKSAEQLALAEGDQVILGNLHVYDVTIKEVE